MDPAYAKSILNKLGSSGTPPESGIELFTVGLEKYLTVLEAEYLQGILRYNLSSFKLVVGNYGGGKTHFLYAVRNLAFRNNFVVAYVTLSPTECPFDRLELVYRQVVSNLMPPVETGNPAQHWNKGIEALIRVWHASVCSRMASDNQAPAGAARTADSPEIAPANLHDYLTTVKGTESSSFLNAAKAAFSALTAGDEDCFAAVTQWLKGEEIPSDIRTRYRISERIDRSTAFRMLRSLTQWVHTIGYAGLILLFDEAERGMSISSSRDRRRALDNLRQLVDECGNSRLPGAMLFYAVPDDTQLLDGSGGVYEALKQRLRSVFSEVNPVGVRIDLENLDLEPKEFLRALGLKLAALFETAYSTNLPPTKIERVVNLLSDMTLAAFQLDVSYRRLFVIAIVEALYRLRANPAADLTTKDAERILRVTTEKLTADEQASSSAEEF